MAVAGLLACAFGLGCRIRLTSGSWLRSGAAPLGLSGVVGGVDCFWGLVTELGPLLGELVCLGMDDSLVGESGVVVGVGGFLSNGIGHRTLSLGEQ